MFALDLSWLSGEVRQRNQCQPRLRLAKSSVAAQGRPRDRAPALAHGNPCLIGAQCAEGGVMAKRFGRPSLQYRYEHYDPEV